MSTANFEKISTNTHLINTQIHRNKDIRMVNVTLELWTYQKWTLIDWYRT